MVLLSYRLIKRGVNIFHSSYHLTMTFLEDFAPLFYVGALILVVAIPVVVTIRKRSKIKQKFKDDELHGQEFEGKVNAFSKSSEPYGTSSIQVWTFRLLRFDDKLGNPLPKIPWKCEVQLSEGFINDGDSEGEGKWKEGEVRKINELYNKTDNIWVKAKDSV